MILAYLFYLIRTDPTYVLTGTHLDITGNGIVTKNGVRSVLYSNIETCTAHEGITEISEYAFQDCSSMIDIRLPSTLKKILSGSFCNTRIKNLNITENVEVINIAMLIHSNTAFSEYLVHEYNGYFASYKKCLYTSDFKILLSAPIKIDSISFHPKTTEIGSWALYRCLVDEINVSDSIEKLNTHAFLDFDNVRINFGIESKVKELPSNCFQYSTIQFFHCPPRVTKINSRAFYHCSILSFDYMNGSILSELSNEVFYFCTKLENVSLPSSISSISPTAFNGCSSLKNLIIPNDCPNYQSIGGVIFSGDNKTMIFIANSVESINLTSQLESISISLLQKQKNLRYVNIPDDCDAFSFHNGIIYNKDFSKAIHSLGSINQITIKSECLSFEKYLFAYTDISEIIFSCDFNLTSVGDSCFYKCKKLVSVSLPDSVYSLGERSFRESSIQSIEVPSRISSLSSYLFCGCSSLRLITFRSNYTLKTLHSYCFENCNLNQLNLPSSLTTISGYSFQSTTIDSLLIPANVSQILSPAFLNANIREIIFESGSNLTSILSQTFKQSKINKIKMGLNIINVESDAFADCIKLKTIEWPNDSKLEKISASAFRGCSSLITMNLPSSVTSVDPTAFYQCSKLQEFVIPDEAAYEAVNGVLYHIGTKTLSVCPPGISNHTVISGTTSIGYHAFYGASSLKSLLFSEPSSLVTIGSETFFECSMLSSLHLPRSLTSIGESALENSAIKSVTFEEGCLLESIGASAFAGCSLIESICIPSMVHEINKSLFKGCSKLSNVTFDSENSDIETLPESCFEGCSSLEIIKVPLKIKNIMAKCFASCGLIQITVPPETKSIGHMAFSSCQNLIRVFYCGIEKMNDSSVFLNHNENLKILAMTSYKWITICGIVCDRIMAECEYVGTVNESIYWSINELSFYASVLLSDRE